MATYYVSSVAGNNTTGLSWANAKTTLAAGLALATNTGDIIYVDSEHTEEITANLAITAASSGIAIQIICVDRNGSTTTGHNGWQTMQAAGSLGITSSTTSVGVAIAGSGAQHLYIFGLRVEMHTTNASGNSITICITGGDVVNKSVVLDTCYLSTPSTSASTTVIFGAGPASSSNQPVIILKDCTIKLRNNTGTSGEAIQLRQAKGLISNLTLELNASIPKTLFATFAGTDLDWEIENSDLSNYDPATSFYVDVDSMSFGQITFRNCKLNATPTFITGTWVNNATFVMAINCDSTDTKTKFGYYNRLGTLLSTESIYRDSGFSVGGINVGWQIVTTADCNEAEPFITPWMTGGFNASTSALTAAIKLIHDSATNLDDREAWMEVSYVSDASFPLGTLASTRNAQPFDGTGADLAADTDAWTGTGGFSNANKQKASKTFTPAEGSAIEGRLLVGVASKTLYLDPQLVIS